VLVLALIAAGGLRLVHLLSTLPLAQWTRLTAAGGLTLLRVLVSTAVGTAWAVPVGLAIGLSPVLSRLLQPVAQVLASFPAPMLFPAAIALFQAAGLGLGLGSVLLMLLGTQWYILFNVIAGASAVPSDLKEAAVAFRMPRRERLLTLYLPAIFPYLVTGWVTAAGGAWNASIVSEYVTYKGATLTTFGLGAAVSRAAEDARFPELAAAVQAEGSTQEALRLIAGLLERERAAGRLALADPAFAAEQFLYMVKTIPQRRAMGLGTPLAPTELEAWAADVVALFLNGFRGGAETKETKTGSR